MRPSQGFWGFREKGYLFSGIWGEGSFIFRDLGRKRGFREQGTEEKHFRELGRKVIFLSGSREQRPPWEGLFNWLLRLAQEHTWCQRDSIPQSIDSDSDTPKSDTPNT